MKFLFLLLFSGCSAITSGNISHLTPEQIEAYAKVKQSLIGCSIIGGPPISGRSILLVLPPDYKYNVKFGPDCQILNQ